MPITIPRAQHQQTNKHMRTPTEKIHSLIIEGGMEEVITYLHKALVITKTSTLLRVVENKNLTTWPALTKINIKKYLPKSVEISLGQLNQAK